MTRTRIYASVITTKEALWVVGGVGSSGSAEVTTILDGGGGFTLHTDAFPFKAGCVSQLNATHWWLTAGWETSEVYIVDIRNGTAGGASNSPKLVFHKIPAEMTRKRPYAACTTITKGRYAGHLMVAGGASGDNSLASTTTMYSLADGQWTEGPNLPRPFYGGGYITYPDGRLILAGGQEREREGFKLYDDILQYDPETNEFTTLPGKLKDPKSKTTATLVVVGDVVPDDDDC